MANNEWWKDPIVSRFVNPEAAPTQWAIAQNGVPVGNTGYGPDGINQRRKPTAVIQTANGPLALHEGEPLIQMPDGSTRVVSQAELESVITRTKTPGMLSGGVFDPIKKATAGLANAVESAVGSATQTNTPQSSNSTVASPSSVQQVLGPQGEEGDDRPTATAYRPAEYKPNEDLTGTTVAGTNFTEVPTATPRVRSAGYQPNEGVQIAPNTSQRMQVPVQSIQPPVIAPPAVPKSNYEIGMEKLRGIVTGTDAGQRAIADRAILNQGLAGGASVAATEQKLAGAGVDQAGIASMTAVERRNVAADQGKLTADLAATAQGDQRTAATALANQGWIEKTYGDQAATRMATDAKVMDFESFKAKYPTATQESYDAARGTAMTPQQVANAGLDNISSLMSAGQPGAARKQYERMLENPSTRAYLESINYVPPDWDMEAAKVAVPSIESDTDALIAYMGKDQLSDYSDSPTFRSDMIDFVSRIRTSGGSIDPTTGVLTNPRNLQLPWEDPDTVMNYIDIDGQDIPPGQNPNDPAWLNATITVGGKQTTRQAVRDFWNGMLDKDPTIATNPAYTDRYGNPDPKKIALAATGGAPSTTIPFTGNIGTWLKKPENSAALTSYDKFRESLADDPVYIIDKDGNKVALDVTDPNLVNIWAGIQRLANNGDYTQAIDGTTIPSGSFKVDAQGNVTRATLADDVSTRVTLGSMRDNQTDRWRIKALEGYPAGTKTGPVSLNIPGVGWRSLEYVSSGKTEKGGPNLNDWDFYIMRDPETGKQYRIRAEGKKITTTEIGA